MDRRQRFVFKEVTYQSQRREVGKMVAVSSQFREDRTSAEFKATRLASRYNLRLVDAIRRNRYDPPSWYRPRRQVVRQRFAKPSFPGSNPGEACQLYGQFSSTPSLARTTKAPPPESSPCRSTAVTSSPPQRCRWPFPGPTPPIRRRDATGSASRPIPSGSS